jgi:hypothetical protein
MGARLGLKKQLSARKRTLQLQPITSPLCHVCSHWWISPRMPTSSPSTTFDRGAASNTKGGNRPFAAFCIDGLKLLVSELARRGSKSRLISFFLLRRHLFNFFDFISLNPDVLNSYFDRQLWQNLHRYSVREPSEKHEAKDIFLKPASGLRLTEESVLGFPTSCVFASLAYAQRNFPHSRLLRPSSS